MFSSSFDENHASYQPYNGWNRSNSNEYSTHVPSAVPIIPITYVSPRLGQYSNQGQFNNMNYEGEAPYRMHSQHQTHQHAPQAHKSRVHFAEHDTISASGHAPQARKGRVHFAEHDTTTEVVDRKNGRLEVHQDSIDEEADGFIRLKHKNFELSKWETFKGY
ncbi:hypothetical protein AG4045_030344 [Apium graveolens]|uniref:Uncharacterized protein n=1 Tax=Apium graveolens TaxID=4045 RepID=A0A6L5BBT8_APIGR|nr:hypothetical protein AG4045_030344 [Apium graveolens]